MRVIIRGFKIASSVTKKVLVYTGPGKRVVPKLRESQKEQDAISHNLGDHSLAGSCTVMSG